MSEQPPKDRLTTPKLGDLDALSALAEAASLTVGNVLERAHNAGHIWLRAVPSGDDVSVEGEDAALLYSALPALIARVRRAEAALSVERIAEAMCKLDRDYVGMGTPWSGLIAGRRPYMERALALSAALKRDSE